MSNTSRKPTRSWCYPHPRCRILLNFANSAGDLNGAYDEHALCLARDSGRRPAAGRNGCPIERT
jgi:hypothetical protein